MFKTTHSAEIGLPREGFTLADLKDHMRKTKVPADSRLRPAIVRDSMDPEADPEVRFVAEWEDD